MSKSNLTDRVLRERLIAHTQGGEAFLPIDQILESLSIEQVGIVPDSLPYSLYQQFVHLHRAQADIIDYCLNPEYQAMSWPDDYWPDNTAPQYESEWELVQKEYFSDRKRWCDFLANTDAILTDPIPHAPDHNYLREALLIIEHTAYHTGEMVVLMRLLGIK
jgi:uncharacterized damage-inducible protein DinB